MKKIFLITLLLASIVFSEINIISPSGTYFLGDSIYLIGNYKGNCQGNIALKLDGSTIVEKYYSFEGVTDLSQVFPNKINASIGSHSLELKSNCFEPVIKNFKVTGTIPINYGLNAFDFMTGEKVVISAYGVKGKKILPCKIVIENKSFINSTSYSFNTPGAKEIKLITEDNYGNKGEKTVYVKVFDKLMGEASTNKSELNPGENLTIKLKVVDFFNRSINYDANAIVFGKNYSFKKEENESTSLLIIPINQKQAPGNYNITINFKQGNNKGNLSLHFKIKNKAQKMIIIKNEKNSTSLYSLVKIILLNQINNPFTSLVNATISINGNNKTMQVQSGKEFKVPAGATITASYGKIKAKKTLGLASKTSKENEKGTASTGLSTGEINSKNNTLVWSFLFFLIIISIFFLRNSELATEL